MRISAINNYNTKSYNAAQKQASAPVNFGSNVNTYLLLHNPRFKNIVTKGYHIFDSEIKVIDPNGKAVTAIAFVKDDLRIAGRNLNMLLTDEDCYALGEISASDRNLSYYKSLKALGTVIRNYTVSKQGERLQFASPFVDARFSDTAGEYKHVGKNLYSSLIKYLKKHHPDKDILVANVNTNESWNFHRACGFTMDTSGKNIPPIDGCDTYSPCGEDLYYRLK